MSQAMYISCSGALVQEKRLEVLANNISNINTVGFKEDRPTFRVYLPASPGFIKGSPHQIALISGKPQFLPSCPPINSYVEFDGIKTNFSPGQMKHTGNALDLALNGDGFFSIETPQGIRYTRQGNFTLNQEKLLVTPEGLAVLGKRGKIIINGKDIVVDSEGRILVDGNLVDTLKIVDFTQPYPLKNSGIGNRAGEVEIKQGFLELSNVNTIRMMTGMIEALRAYEAYQKVIQSVDEATSKTINEVGRVA